MGIFSAMNAAVSGLNAQARAMGHISDNIANVSTVGYKKIGTDFYTLVTQSGARSHSPGGVVSLPSYNVGVQGQIQTSPVKTHLAINGGGFFIVRNFPDDTDTIGLNRQDFFVRKGDFTTDADGNLVNSSGYYLQGRAYDVNTGDLRPGGLSTVRVSNMTGLARATQDASIGANLPASSRINSITAASAEVATFNGLPTAAAAGGEVYSLAVDGITISATMTAGDDPATEIAAAIAADPTLAGRGFAATSPAAGELQITGASDGSAFTVEPGNTGAAETGRTLGRMLIQPGGSDHFAEMTLFDSQGQAHTVRTEWVKTGANQWAMRFLEKDASNNWLTLNTNALTVNFGADGTLGSIVGGTDGTVMLAPTTGVGNFALTNPPWQWDDDPIGFDFGTPGQPVGLTQYSAEFAVTELRQDGLEYGQFTELSVDEYGDVYAQYRNGAATRIFNLPLATFTNPNGLQNVDGNAYRASAVSGDAAILMPGVGRAGTIIAEALEGSNVDIAEEFTQMIKTQRAYSANSKVITTSDQMMEEIINIKR